MYHFYYALAWGRMCAPARAKENRCNLVSFNSLRRCELEIRRRSYCTAFSIIAYGLPLTFSVRAEIKI